MKSFKRKIASQNNGKKGGRPIASTTLITQKIRERVIVKLHERIDPIIDSQINSAIGIILKKIDSKGLSYYSEEPPNTSAAKFLIEQAIGRPQEKIEHSGDTKGLVALITALNDEDNGYNKGDFE